MEPINIRSKSMLGTTHSWAVTMRALLSQFDIMGHNMHLSSINGYDFFPLNLSGYKRTSEFAIPDLDITYTLPRNFENRFQDNSKVKMAIYNYETSILPDVWRDSHRFIDYVLPSSSFSKDIFLRAGWPEEKCVVVPHGINIDDFRDSRLVSNLRTKKKFKFLNVSIPHYRKNIDVLVDAYYSAFTDKDDVCLIMKTSLRKPKFRFECDITKEVLKAQRKHRGRSLPQIEVVETKYESMIPLYNSCDCIVSASSSEGFGLPLLEGLASGLIVIAPRYSGHLDFLNDNNSLLVDISMVKADGRYQYWRESEGAITSIPKVPLLAEMMRRAYDDYSDIKSRFQIEAKNTTSKFTWESAAKKIIELQS